MRANISLNEEEFLEILKKVGFKNPKIECGFGDVDVSFDFVPRDDEISFKKLIFSEPNFPPDDGWGIKY